MQSLKDRTYAIETAFYRHMRVSRKTLSVATRKKSLALCARSFSATETE